MKGTEGLDKFFLNAGVDKSRDISVVIEYEVQTYGGRTRSYNLERFVLRLKNPCHDSTFVDFTPMLAFPQKKLFRTYDSLSYIV
jgi:hypothetical protein